MLYCSSCGKQVPADIKFCPYCGWKVDQSIDKPLKLNKVDVEFKDKRDKAPIEPEEDLEDDISRSSLPSRIIGIYFILNFILMMGNPYSDEIIGIFIYTWIVLAIIFIRRNKDKPFNWLLNVFVSLQVILVFATIMMTLDYVDMGGDSIGAVIQLGLLVLLLITILVLLYKGNRRVS